MEGNLASEPTQRSGPGSAARPGKRGGTRAAPTLQMVRLTSAARGMAGSRAR